MNIGLVDVDGHNFPNFALMRLSACYKAKGTGWNGRHRDSGMTRYWQARYSPSRLIMTMTCWMWGKW